MLTVDQLRAELARYTYRPGWVMTIDADEWEGPQWWLTATVPNAYDPETTVRLSIRSLVPPVDTPDEFAHWLSWRLQQVESHESREWLRCDGRPVFDPHMDRHAPN